MPRRFYRRPALPTLLFFALVVGLVFWTTFRLGSRVPEGEREVAAAFGGPAEVLLRPGRCQIVRVMDAATLLVRQKDFDGQTEVSRLFRVRLLGVKTPPNVDRAAERDDDPAAHALKALARSSSEAVIDLDKRRIAADESWLAYVYCGEKLLNAEMIRAGAAKYDNYPGDNASIARRLRQAQDEARRAKRGVWSDQ